MRYQVTFALGKVLDEAAQKNMHRLSEKLDINEEHIRKLIRGTWTDVTIDQLQRISTWARKRDINPPTLFHTETRHPLWSTFSDGHADLFIGVNLQNKSEKNDLDARSALAGFLEDDKATINTRSYSPTAMNDRATLVEEVRHAMRTTNCVFLCGPLRNPASEIAASLLWRAEPFDGSRDNAWKLPFHITYHRKQPHQALDSTFASLSDERHARSVNLRSEGKVWNLAFPYQAEKDWLKASEKAVFDYAVVAVCRKPLGTNANVSTVIVMGLTGFATREACESIAREELHIATMRDDVPELHVFCAKFKKEAGPDDRKKTDGCKWIAEPWDHWPSKSAVRESRTRTNW